MTSTAMTAQNSQKSQKASEPPETFLSCYEIVNSDVLRWEVKVYKVRRDSGGQTHGERGDAKQVVWELRKKTQSRLSRLWICGRSRRRNHCCSIRLEFAK